MSSGFRIFQNIKSVNLNQLNDLSEYEPRPSVNQIQKESYLFSLIGTWWVHLLAAITCYLIYIMKKNQKYSNDF